MLNHTDRMAPGARLVLAVLVGLGPLGRGCNGDADGVGDDDDLAGDDDDAGDDDSAGDELFVAGDNPFLFLIRDRVTGLWLFLGRVGNPRT